jgi:hypothetical protein
MSATATAPSVTPEERLRTRALDTLKTAALEAILASDEPLRTVDLGREVADRLQLSLNEEELGGLSSLVRMVLDSDPMFSQSNRQWDLAVRMGRAEADRRKPVERAIEDFIDLLGHPTDPHPVAVLVAAMYGRDPEYYERMMERVAPTREQFFLTRDKKIGITRWLIEITSDEPEDVEYDNFEDTSYLDALRPVAEKAKGGSPRELAQAIIKNAGDPVSTKALSYFVWRAFPDSEPQAVFNELYSDGGRLSRGPSWETEAAGKQVMDTLRKLAQNPDDVAGLVAAAAPAEEEDRSGFMVQTTARVSDEDLDQVYNYMLREERTYRISELCQQVLEAFPGSRTYADIHQSLRSRMTEDPRFSWVGTERFRTFGSIPAEIENIPEGLALDEGEYLGEEGVEIDRMVDPREWKAGLDEQVMEYQVQDFGDDDSDVPAIPPAKLVSSPPLHHYVAGTRYLRNADRGFFPVEPSVVQVTLLSGDQRFDVWVHGRLGLIFGLKEWYDANLPWVGGKFTLERTDQPDEFRLNHTAGDTEPLMDIPMDKLQELLILRGEAAAEGLPLTEIVTRVLKSNADGLPFVTLFAAVNVVRRVRRAQVASVLSGQKSFQQTAGQWTFDEKKAAKATKKKGGPKRPMRGMIDDDDEFEYE